MQNSLEHVYPLCKMYIWMSKHFILMQQLGKEYLSAVLYTVRNFW